MPANNLVKIPNETMYDFSVFTYISPSSENSRSTYEHLVINNSVHTMQSNYCEQVKWDQLMNH